MERESTPEAGISEPQGREGARMESVLLAVALLGFGIGGYFVVGRVARFFAMGTSGRSAGRGARSKEREDMPWLSRQWPTPPEQEKPREKGGKSSRLAG